LCKNYPQPSASELQARKEEDIKNISKLLNQVLATNVNYQCYSPWKGPRLTKITVASIEEKSFILPNHRNLRDNWYPSHVQRNIRSLNKHNQLAALFDLHDIDIVLVTESHLD